MPMEPFETESHLAEDVSLFEAATHARPVRIETPALDSIVLAPDGSNQDATARAFAQALAAAAGAAVHEHPGAATAADILQACTAHRANLLVLPVPFGRDIGVLKDESLGSVVDMVLLESACPVFCVRQVLDAAGVGAALSDVLVPLTVHEDHARAAAWAFRILVTGGRLELREVADRDVLEEARHLLGERIDPAALRDESLRRTVAHDARGLVAAAQRLGPERGVAVHVEFRAGRFVEVVLEDANRRPRLVVVGAPKDHLAPAYHRAADIVLGAHGPVLVV
jgi:hypothetical protein